MIQNKVKALMGSFWSLEKVVGHVMATDIVDKDLTKLREARWDKAFCMTKMEEDKRTSINRKATITNEHLQLMQASDAFHTMQRWYIYRK
jgi:hypothetical protein